jgi:hypothetical protein
VLVHTVAEPNRKLPCGGEAEVDAALWLVDDLRWADRFDPD